MCLGAKGSKKCVGNGNPGDVCDLNPGSDSSIGVCGGNEYLTCGDDAICVDGKVGDSCKQDSHCKEPLTCKGNVCAPLSDSSSCDSSNQCSPLSFCDSDVYECTPKKTVGTVCDYNECVYGNICSYKKEEDLVKFCIETFSKENGEYCENNMECKSKRCGNDRCVKASGGGPCNIDSHCAYGEFCGCNGIYLETGYGRCYPDPCIKKKEVPFFFLFFLYFSLFFFFFFFTFPIQYSKTNG